MVIEYCWQDAYPSPRGQCLLLLQTCHICCPVFVTAQYAEIHSRLCEGVLTLSSSLHLVCNLFHWKFDSSPKAPDMELRLPGGRGRLVTTLLQQMQDKFQTMSDQIIGRIDEMSARIDDLEKNIADLMTQAGVEEIEAGENKAPK
ncbi:heat shock factor-binding protein 1b isoform X1 [Mobula birostris]|uniref:heat shock factor-binding protein 1b isoform X1 n=1 Tax=Mobula birostris TaxID=1983395 RepID=UPI003B284E85